MVSMQSIPLALTTPAGDAIIVFWLPPDARPVIMPFPNRRGLPGAAVGSNWE